LQVPTPQSAGVPGNAISQNIGTSSNRGIELSLSGDIIRNKDFQWGFNANFTSVNNEIKSLYTIGDNPVLFIPNGAYNLIQVGDPINVIHGLRFAGVNPTNGNPMYYKADNQLVQHNTSGVTGGSLNAFYFAKSIDDPTFGAQTSLTFADRAVLGKAGARLRRAAEGQGRQAVEALAHPQRLGQRGRQAGDGPSPSCGSALRR
jgi:hypothetical protein